MVPHEPEVTPTSHPPSSAVQLPSMAATGRAISTTNEAIRRITPMPAVLRTSSPFTPCLQFRSLRKSRSHHWLASSQVPVLRDEGLSRPIAPHNHSQWFQSLTVAGVGLMTRV